MMLVLLLSVTLAGDKAVLRTGDTVESLAGGDASLASRIRALNGLAPGEQPQVGSLIDLPDVASGHPMEAAALNVYRGASAALPGGLTVDLAPGMALPAGTRVCTTDEGYATLRLALAESGRHHDDITLLPGTCLTIHSTSSRASGRRSVVQLEAGSVTVPRPEAGTTAGEITVATESGITTADRGGFRVHVESDAARTEALYNGLSVFGAGEEQRLEAGQGSRVFTGQAPSEPVDLLPSGRPTDPTDGATLRRPDFAWARVDTALGYQVELARSEDFREMLVARSVDRPAWEPARLLLPGDVEGIWWRVSTIDRHGFIGVPSAPRVLELPAGVSP